MSTDTQALIAALYECAAHYGEATIQQGADALAALSREKSASAATEQAELASIVAAFRDSLELPEAMQAPPPDYYLTVMYRNWRGEVAERHIVPKFTFYGSDEWHPQPQFLLAAYDVDKKAMRHFALKDFGAPERKQTGDVRIYPNPDPSTKHAWRCDIDAGPGHHGVGASRIEALCRAATAWRRYEERRAPATPDKGGAS